MPSRTLATGQREIITPSVHHGSIRTGPIQVPALLLAVPSRLSCPVAHLSLLRLIL